MAGYIFDLDGTIYLGDKIIEGALETYNYLISKNHKVVFVTHKSIASQEDYLRKLTKFGFDVTVNQIELPEFLEKSTRFFQGNKCK